MEDTEQSSREDHSVNGSSGWKYISVIIGIAIVVGGALFGRVWEIGTAVPSRGEIRETFDRHDKSDSEKFSYVFSRLAALEAVQSTRTEQLVTLDVLLKELRRQHDELRAEIRKDVSDTKREITSIKELLRK